MLGLGMAGRGRVIGSSRARELGAGFLCLAAALKSSGDAGFGSLGMMGWMATRAGTDASNKQQMKT